MRPFTDEQLAAYADGELDAAEAAAVTEAARADPELARRLVRFTETRRVLRETFAGTLDEPVPRRLLDTLAAAPARPFVPRRRAWLPLALAASVMAGVGTTALVLLLGPAPATPLGLPPDAAALARVLEHTPSGVPVQVAAGGKSYEVLPLATLRTVSGTYCREFQSAIGTDRPVQAAACRQPDGAWTVAAVAIEPPPGNAGSAGPQEYRPAGADAPTVGAVLGDTRRLTPVEESALLGRGWQDH